MNAWTQSWGKWTWTTKWRETAQWYEKWLLHLPAQHAAIGRWYLTVEVVEICSSLWEQNRGNRRKYWRECVSEVLSTWSKTNRQFQKQTVERKYLEKLTGILGCTAQLCYDHYLVLGTSGTFLITQKRNCQGPR